MAEVVGWHHRLNGCELGQALGDGVEQEACHTAVHVSPRVGHNRVTEQQQSRQGKRMR